MAKAAFFWVAYTLHPVITVLDQKETIVHVLLKRLRQKKFTRADEELLRDWLAQSPHRKELFDELSDEDALKEEIKLVMRYDSETVWNKVLFRITEQEKPKRVPGIKPFMRYAAAIAFLLFLAVSSYVLFFVAPSKPEPVSEVDTQTLEAVNDFDAILTLPTGEKVPLHYTQYEDSVSITEITRAKALITGHNQSIDNSALPVYYTVSTRRGARPFAFILPDGTTAWLNAASSIRYPTTFETNRKIEISGEVCFEMTKKTSRPFTAYVVSHWWRRGDSIGIFSDYTNIKAYDDEPGITTTRIGQLDGHSFRIEDDEKYRALAWKDGSIEVVNADLYSLMRLLKRYYDVDVVYERKPKSPRVYTFYISRDTSLTDILAILRRTGTESFKLNGKKVIVRS